MKRLNNLIDLAADSGDKSILAKIRELEATITTLGEQKAAWAERKDLKERLLAVNPEQIRTLLAAHGAELVSCP
jgi:hypothetical protein